MEFGRKIERFLENKEESFLKNLKNILSIQNFLEFFFFGKIIVLGGKCCAVFDEKEFRLLLFQEYESMIPKWTLKMLIAG